MADPNAGLINTIPDQTRAAGYVPASATAVQATAAPFTVAPNQTVASNVKNIISEDSPLLQQANSRAMQQANARGLLNSSIALSAGQSALYDAALPIATADAATYDRAATNTVQAQNTAGLMNAQLGTGVSTANAGAANTMTLADRDAASRKQLLEIQNSASLTLADKQAASQKVLAQMQVDSAQLIAERNAGLQTELQKMKGTQATDLANIEANYKQLTQTNASAGAAFNEATAQISTILRDPNTSAEQKESAVSGVTQMLRSNMATMGAIADLDLGSLLDFSGVGAGATGKDGTATGAVSSVAPTVSQPYYPESASAA